MKQLYKCIVHSKQRVTLARIPDDVIECTVKIHHFQEFLAARLVFEIFLQYLSFRSQQDRRLTDVCKQMCVIGRWRLSVKDVIMYIFHKVFERALRMYKLEIILLEIIKLWCCEMEIIYWKSEKYFFHDGFKCEIHRWYKWIKLLVLWCGLDDSEKGLASKTVICAINMLEADRNGGFSMIS